MLVVELPASHIFALLYIYDYHAEIDFYPDQASLTTYPKADIQSIAFTKLSNGYYLVVGKDYLDFSDRYFEIVWGGISHPNITNNSFWNEVQYCYIKETTEDNIWHQEFYKSDEDLYKHFFRMRNHLINKI